MIYAQSPANSPLTPDEGRLVLGQLQELGTCRVETATQGDYIARDREQDAREKAIADRALEVERAAAAVERDRTAIAEQKAALYEQLYRSVTKGPGAGCRILRALTFGIYRCN